MFKQTHTGGRVIETKTTNAPEGDSGVTTESGKKASCKKLPLRKVVIIWIVVCITVAIDAVQFYYMVLTPVINLVMSASNGSYASFEEYSGTIEEIQATGTEPYWYDSCRSDSDTTVEIVGLLISEGVLEPTPEPVFENVDSVEVGTGKSYRSPKEAIIKISGEDGEKYFFANTNTYVFDSISNSRGLAYLEVGQSITIAYGSKEGIDDYDYVYAIKGAVPVFKYLNIIGAYAVYAVLPSLLFAFVTIFILCAISDRIANKETRKGTIITVAIVVIILLAIVWFGIDSYLKASKKAASSITAHAPIIYLYNDSDEQINVKLDLDGELTVTYPEYPTREGWTVSASPDGLLTDPQGQEYPFLFWEAELNMDYDLSKGFCVKGSDTEEFLDEVLPELGLNETEMEDFEAYWLPLMADNPYNVITFQTTAYDDAVSHSVTPEPNTVISINMLWYASDEFVSIEPQDLTGINPSLDEREGFVFVEWGGEEIDGIY